MTIIEILELSDEKSAIALYYYLREINYSKPAESYVKKNELIQVLRTVNRYPNWLQPWRKNIFLQGTTDISDDVLHRFLNQIFFAGPSYFAIFKTTYSLAMTLAEENKNEWFEQTDPSAIDIENLFDNGDNFFANYLYHEMQKDILSIDAKRNMFWQANYFVGKLLKAFAKKTYKKIFLNSDLERFGDRGLRIQLKSIRLAETPLEGDEYQCLLFDEWQLEDYLQEFGDNKKIDIDIFKILLELGYFENLDSDTTYLLLKIILMEESIETVKMFCTWLVDYGCPINSPEFYSAIKNTLLIYQNENALAMLEVFLENGFDVVNLGTGRIPFLALDLDMANKDVKVSIIHLILEAVFCLRMELDFYHPLLRSENQQGYEIYPIDILYNYFCKDRLPVFPDQDDSPALTEYAAKIYSRQEDTLLSDERIDFLKEISIGYQLLQMGSFDEDPLQYSPKPPLERPAQRNGQPFGR